jgi:hypothetical protein
MFFFIFLLADGRIRLRTNKLRIQIHKAQKHMDPTDPDPKHGF